MSLGDAAYRVAVYALVVAIATVTLFPLAYAVSISLRPMGALLDLRLVPPTVSLETWTVAVESLAPTLVNSVVIATGAVGLSLAVTVPGAYVFGRTTFRWKRPLFYLVVVSLLFPHVLLVVPITDLWRDIGLFNSFVGLWLAHQIFVTPWVVWILRDFFERLPDNLEEAAMVYGCTRVSAIYRVVVPLSTPAVVAVAFLAFLTAWNDFLFANILTTSDGPRPATVQLFLDVYGTETVNWRLLMAESLIVGLPPALLYVAARRYLQETFAIE